MNSYPFDIDKLLIALEEKNKILETQFLERNKERTERKYAAYVSRFDNWWDRLWKKKPRIASSLEEMEKIVSEEDIFDPKAFVFIREFFRLLDRKTTILNWKRNLSALKEQGFKEAYLSRQEVGWFFGG